METPLKLFMVDRKRVAIIKANTHTYNVRFVKSGKFMEVKKEYVKSFTPSATKIKPFKPIPKKPKDSQTSLDL